MQKQRGSSTPAGVMLQHRKNAWQSCCQSAWYLWLLVSTYTCASSQSNQQVTIACLAHVCRHFDMFEAPPRKAIDGFRNVMSECLQIPYLLSGVSPDEQQHHGSDQNVTHVKQRLQRIANNFILNRSYYLWSLQVPQCDCWLTRRGQAMAKMWM